MPVTRCFENSVLRVGSPWAYLRQHFYSDFIFKQARREGHADREIASCNFAINLRVGQHAVDGGTRDAQADGDVLLAHA